ncbi:hypothetical protein [Pseudonocardia alni]|uniref:2-keto-3-deoxy-L-rhamnonate aldolase RhmA n=1 Tax=Pseudonocardia alni TaxID=33907 RepID=A0A852WDL4_PSEA5|nr:hypothetical protein [Pseudonocardia antarctica]NYG04804.1 2-keto-3-deoxy-L-rhamnonate aldolase RhmA [Pseudonocardia antarctica]
MKWIAAALAPRDIAPHPNFMSSEIADGPSIFALITSLHLKEIDRLDSTQNSIRSGPDDRLSSTDRRIVRTCTEAVLSSTSSQGCEALAILLDELEQGDAARYVALGLFYVMIACDLGQYDRAFSRLTKVRQAISKGVDHADLRLLNAIVDQQIAFRKFDLSREDFGKGDAESALDSLTKVDPSRITKFQTSEGVSWDSQSTISAIASSIRSCAGRLISACADISDNSWADNVRARPSFNHLRQDRRTVDGYRSNLKEAFNSTIGSTAVRFASSDFGDSDLYSSLIFSEMNGDISARGRRTDLAVLRFLSSVESSESRWLRTESLRLFRQARNGKMLRSVVRFTRANGPLACLREASEELLREPEEYSLIDQASLALLEGAATTLEQSTADVAVARLLRSMEHPPPSRPRSWQADSSRAEEVWKATAAVASVANQTSEIAQVALNQVTDLMNPDELLERAYARSLRSLDWSSVEDHVKDRWIAWMSHAGDSCLLIQDALRPYLLGRFMESDQSTATTRSPIDTVALSLNDYLVHQVEIPSGVYVTGVTLIRERLASIRQKARQGVHSMGEYSYADIGVGLAISGTEPALWHDLAEFFTDPLVSREDKAPALDRVARSTEVPDSFVRTLRDASDSLLRSPASHFSPGPSVFPAALRALTALSAIEDSTILRYCLEIVASSDSLARVEAARTLTTLARRQSSPEWTTVFALQLSADRDAGTRAEAARSLTLLSARNRDADSSVNDRIVELLRADGLTMPILMLDAISESGSTSGAVIHQLSTLATDHISVLVRDRARQVLDGLT